MKEIFHHSDEFSRVQDISAGAGDTFSPSGEVHQPAGEFYQPQGEDFSQPVPVTATEKKSEGGTSKGSVQKLIRRMGYLVAASVTTISLGSTVKLPSFHPGLGGIEGELGAESDTAVAFVCDAETRIALEAEIEIYDENDNKILTVHSEGSKGYEAKLDVGEYKAIVKANDYLPLETHFYQEFNGPMHQVFALSVALKPGQMRIVLQWGAMPRDLDAHFYNIAGDHVDFSDRYLRRWDGDAQKDIAFLDVDDTSSYGPETITIFDTKGTYFYTVHDFSNGDTYSTMAEDGHVIVQVYTYGSMTPQIYRIPHSENREGNWRVFRIDDGRITFLNELTFTSPGQEFLDKY